MQKFTKVLGFNISTELVTEIVNKGLKSDKQVVINTLNPHSYVEQKSDVDFNKALLQSDILIPDGSGIVMAAKFINNVIINKIAGYDLFIETMSRLNVIGGKVFFLGSSENVLGLIRSRAALDFPNVMIEIHSPEYKNSFDKNDLKNFAVKINEFQPEVVFVGLTAPKQEKLINNLKDYTNVKYLSGIGAVFDFYAGTVERPSKLWIKLHLEWLPRLVKEPKRLWKRNFVSTPVFLFDMIRSKLFK